MWRRWSSRAAETLRLAQQEAALAGDGWIGTEHLLLGLLAQDGTGVTRALVEMGVHPDRVRRRVVALIGQGGDDAAPRPGLDARTPGVRQAEGLALAEAVRLAADELEPEQLVVGVAGSVPDLGGRVLAELGVALTRCAILSGRIHARVAPEGPIDLAA